MTSYSRYSEITLAAYLPDSSKDKEDKKETVSISGRTILVTQIPHIKADIASAKNILNRLMADRTSPTTSADEVTSIAPVSYKGGII